MGVSDLLGAVLRKKALKLYTRFEQATHDPRGTQERVLLEKLRRNEDSRFGRDWHLDDIRSVEDFRRRLPVSDYGSFQPYIEDVKRGDFRALFGPGERVLMFAVTSGTYSDPKYIPVTKSFLREYKFGWHVWGIRLLRDYWPLVAHDVLQVVSPSAEDHTEAGIPCGAISGLIVETMPWIVRRKYAVPPLASTVQHAPSKYYLIGRIAAGRRVSYVSAANPSSVLSVVRAVDQERESILRDLHDGGVGDSWEIPAEVRHKLRRRLRPNPERARTLEKIVERTGRLLPVDYWPDLTVIGTWKGGSCGIYLERFPEYFGQVPVRDIGLLASEGRMTVPLTNETNSGPLEITSHFFEFIPEDEIESPNPVVLLPHELKEGGKYFILLTTSSGLYRYNIRDCVRMTGRYNMTPELEFLNKGRYFSSLTGEKLSEFQVVQSLRELPADLKVDVEDGILSPMKDDPPRYSLSVEAQEGRPPGIWGEFLRQFEERLCSNNVEYRLKRTSGRLGAPVLHLLKPGTFRALKNERLESMKGRREQYKHCFLVNVVDFHQGLSVVATLQLEN